MKRYLLFAGDKYYPYPGWLDFVDDFDSWEDAVKQADTIKCDWWHVVDTTTKEIVFYGK